MKLNLNLRKNSIQLNIIFAIIIIILVIININLQIKNTNLNNEIVKTKEFYSDYTQNYWYEIKQSQILIDYPIFTKNLENNIWRIKYNFNNNICNWIDVKNINWDDLSFLKDLQFNIDCEKLSLSFIKYNDENNKIFDVLNNTNLNEINIYFQNKLEWAQTLEKTFRNLKEIINNYSKNKNYNNPIKSLSFWSVPTCNWKCDFWFRDNYFITKKEFEILTQIKIQNLYIANFDFTKNLDKTYLQKQINKSSINYNFWFCWFDISQENWKQIVIENFPKK